MAGPGLGAACGAPLTCAASNAGVELPNYAAFPGITSTSLFVIWMANAQECRRKQLPAPPLVPVRRPVILRGLTAIFLCRAHHVRYSFDHARRFPAFRQSLTPKGMEARCCWPPGCLTFVIHVCVFIVQCSMLTAKPFKRHAFAKVVCRDEAAAILCGMCLGHASKAC
jgi:hypothetical protein